MFFRLMFPVLAALVLAACSEPEPALTDDLIERNNRGVALMGQYRNEQARQVFAELLEERPDWVDVEVNLAIATLNRQEEGDEIRALDIVQGVLEDHPDHLRARYVAGLLRFYLGEAEAALAHFEKVVRDAPDDAHAAYFTGQTLAQLGRTEEAVAQYERAIEIDPYLRSAYYGAALNLRQAGEPARARELLETYQRFEGNPRAQLAEFVYTRMGPLAEAQAVSPDEPAHPVRDPDGPLFEAPVMLAEVDLEPSSAMSLTVADINDSGLLDLMLAGGPGQGNAIFQQHEGANFEPVVDHPLAAITDVNAVFWGDLDNEGTLDVYLCRQGENRLLTSDGWIDAAGAFDLADPLDCANGVLFDADHDGDLDLFVVNRDGPNELFNNNLDGSYRRLSIEANGEFAGGDRASRMALAVDFDGDRDADLIIVHQSPPHQVLRNDRLWRYEAAPGFEDFIQAPLVAVSAGDFDADGQVDLISLDAQGTLERWLPDEGGHWRSRTLAGFELEHPEQAGLAVMDFNGDGRPNVLVHHPGGFTIFALDEAGSAHRIHQQVLDLVAVTPLLLDPAAGPALVGAVADQGGVQLMLWRAGSGRHPFLAIAPSGMTDPGDGMRSNASGIGTEMVVRAGRHWSVLDSYDRHSAPGQSLQPVAVGLGGRERADFVRLLWSDGVLQTEMDLAIGEVHRIAELQRQLASCPVLFAWNGERYEFVSDLLGVAGIGFFLEPGQYSEPRPWEFFKFPEGSIAPREGRYEIKIGEPMEEIAYIDTARLHVFDLPPGWAVTLDERMFTGGGPEPTGQPLFYRQADLIRPARAINDRNEEVTEQVLAADHVAAPPGKRHRHFLGRLARDHVLTLEFDRVINPPGKQPVLIGHGWVEYPYSQTLFAAWQAGAEYRPPSLDAYADGQWHTVYEHFGYPAGMPREMSLPLDALPDNTTQLRLHGNWEVYWDKLAVAWIQSAPDEMVVNDLGIDHGRVARTGFARRDTLDQRLPYYDYNDRSPFWDTRHPTGFYTDFGPVEPLVREANDAFAIFGPGEELHLEFDAPSSPPQGWQRTVILEVRGYAKDMDLYTRDGETVEPLPGVGAILSTERENLHDQYLNRFQGGF